MKWLSDLSELLDVCNCYRTICFGWPSSAWRATFDVSIVNSVVCGHVILAAWCVPVMKLDDFYGASGDMKQKSHTKRRSLARIFSFIFAKLMRQHCGSNRITIIRTVSATTKAVSKRQLWNRIRNMTMTKAEKHDSCCCYCYYCLLYTSPSPRD